MWPAKQGVDLDVDNLYVKQALANDGPRMKRIRPAPMGRAYRYQRRLTHIVLSVAEREAATGLVTKVEEPAAAGQGCKAEEGRGGQGESRAKKHAKQPRQAEEDRRRRSCSDARRRPASRPGGF